MTREIYWIIYEVHPSGDPIIGIGTTLTGIRFIDRNNALTALEAMNSGHTARHYAIFKLEPTA